MAWFFKDDGLPEDSSSVLALLRVVPGLENHPAVQAAVERCVDLFREGMQLEQLPGQEERTGPPAYSLHAPRTVGEAITVGETAPGGSFVILNRAYRAAKKSRFKKPKPAYRALLVLRDHCVPMRREGGPDKQKACKAALEEPGLEESPGFSGARASEQGGRILCAI